MRFVALDVETANADIASICSIGAATFESGRLVSEWSSLIDPRDYFDPVNVSIHGIDAQQVAGAPTFKEAAEEITRLLTGVVVTHTHFDRLAIHQASVLWKIDLPVCTWLDSARVARRSWAECARSGYGLAALASRLGIEFRHHDALEDAKAAGQILLAAMAETGLDLAGVLKRVRQPIDPAQPALIRREANPDGPLFGEVVVFTGALEIPRREAADLAASLGCEVGSGVTKNTTLLVVGDVDVQKLAGHEKSSKHRKAEAMAAAGHPIRVVRETDFRELIAQVGGVDFC